MNNTSEAKVPNIESDWQSIEIYLFSNGQQYSPPRKYSLRAEELNWWDATLNYLAQSHYGIQQPMIYLYTTDGRRVEGPLELRDGMAYVAVQPEDEFVDTGYEKYLIRASRSWEKRQAKKKVKVCESDTPCCVCPEKESFACCLCFEDVTSGESEQNIMAATEQSRGPFMSSALAKAAVEFLVPEYGPTSGGILLDELRPIPGQYGASQNVYGNSQGIAGTRLAKQRAKPIDYTHKPSEAGPWLDKVDPRMEEHEARSHRESEGPTKLSKRGFRNGKSRARKVGHQLKSGDRSVRQDVIGNLAGEHGNRQIEHGAKSGEGGASSGEGVTRINESGSQSNKRNAKLSEHRASSGKDGGQKGKPNEYEAKPAGYDTGPTDYEVGSDDGGLWPFELWLKMDEPEICESERETSLDESGAKQGQGTVRPGGHGSRSMKNDTTVAKGEANMDESGAWTDEYGPTIGEQGPQLIGSETKSGERGRKSNNSGARTGLKSSDHEAKLNDLRSRQGSGRTKMDVYTLRSSEQPSRSIEYGGKPDKHESRSVEHEHRLDTNGKKTGEYGAGPANNAIVGKQDTKMGEHENPGSGPSTRLENTRENDHAGRTGDLQGKTSEHGGRMGDIERKAGNIGGTVGDVGGRAGEHQGRVGDREARADNPGARGGDYEARAGDHGAIEGGHEARIASSTNRIGESTAKMTVLAVRASPGPRLGKNGARVSPGPKAGEPAVRASPGTRASPGSRASPAGKSKVPRLVNPGIRVDDTEIRVGDPGTTVGNPAGKVSKPETKWGSDGGEGGGAAGFPYISEAQQHVRRNSLTTGKQSTEKKRWTAGQQPATTKKQTSHIPLLTQKITGEKENIKNNKESSIKKMTGKNPAKLLNDEVGKMKVLPKYPHKQLAPPTVPPLTANFEQNIITRKSTSLTKMTSIQKSPTADSAPIENVIGDKEIIVISTNQYKNSESEINSMRLDLGVKQVMENIVDSAKETQIELINIPQSITSIAVNEEVQTYVAQVNEGNEKHGIDLDDNYISIIDKGDVVNLKLNIEVRNSGRYNSNHKYTRRSRSLTNITRTEKGSQISFEDELCVQSKSLQSLINNEFFRGSGFEGRPKVLVVQCACCAHKPGCDQASCNDSKKYFVMLPKPKQEDNLMDEKCNCDPACQIYSQKACQPTNRKFSSSPIKKTISDTSLETLRVSSVSQIQKQDMGTYVTTTNSSCQTEDQKSEYLVTKHRVSITEDPSTRCYFQRGSSSQVSMKQDHLMIKSSIPGESPQIEQPIISTQQNYSQPCSQVQSQGIQQKQSQGCQQMQSQGFPRVQSQPCNPAVTCNPTCPQAQSRVQTQSQQIQGVPQIQSQALSRVPSQACTPGCTPGCPQVQSQGCNIGCPQICPQVANIHTQTDWCSILLEARRHEDGRYSFHLPPLNVLRYYTF